LICAGFPEGGSHMEACHFGRRRLDSKILVSWPRCIVWKEGCMKEIRHNYASRKESKNTVCYNVAVGIPL
jgi:hypothetical protein